MNPEMTTCAVTIRPMLPEDLEPVHAIEQRIFTTPWSLTSYRFEMQNPVSKKWVAEVVDVDGLDQIVGMVIVWLFMDKAHIGNLGVDEDYRRQGIACQLLRTALVSCSKQGAVSANLEVRESNIAALTFYDRFNFEQVGRHNGYYHDNGEDAIIMALHDINSTNVAEVNCTNE